MAEVQTPSDTTFRLFDWNRNDPGRPLHLDDALACVDFGAAQQLERFPVENIADLPAVQTRQFRTTLLTKSEHYRIERVEATEAADLPVITKDALGGKHGEYSVVLANPPFGKKSSVTITITSTLPRRAENFFARGIIRRAAVPARASGAERSARS